MNNNNIYFNNSMLSSYLQLLKPTTKLRTSVGEIVYIEDITNDKMLVLRKEISLSPYPNQLGLLTPIPLEYIYVHYPESSNYLHDENVNNAIQKYFAQLDILEADTK
tara:strand:+ start:46 stop:366 length:321 start_codon:yes stop_codon:yes gene_type:complete